MQCKKNWITFKTKKASKVVSKDTLSKIINHIQYDNCLLRFSTVFNPLPIHTPNALHCSNRLQAITSTFSRYSYIDINILQILLVLVLLHILFENSVIINLALHCFAIRKFLTRWWASAVILFYIFIKSIITLNSINFQIFWPDVNEIVTS